MDKVELRRRCESIRSKYGSSNCKIDSNKESCSRKITLEEIQERRCVINRHSEERIKDIEAHAAEEERVINVLHHAKNILERLDQTFEERTALSKVDVSFLFVATALQLLRIYLLPKFQQKIPDSERFEHDDKEIKDMERKEIYKYKEEHKDWESVKSKKGYRGWQEIAFTIKVPYDATRHSGEFDRQMHGGYHRVKTLGHDPLLGWIFGVCNIMTDTITITPEYGEGEKGIRLPLLETYSVDMGSAFCWKEQVPTTDIFTGAYESTMEDKHRLAAAIFSQALHLASDKYTKLGLPVPFLSTIDPDKAYELYKEGYDYLNFRHDIQLVTRTLTSASQSMMINEIIAWLHCLFFNPTKDHDFKFYTIRTRKIILYSNLIATTSDVLQTAIRAYIGDKESINNFDLGGFLVTLYRLCTDTEFIQSVKEEFIYSEWDKIIESENNIFGI